MRNKLALAAVCLAGAGLAPAAGPDFAATPGRNLAATCANCHGTEGRSVGGIASLAGEPRERLLQKLKAYAAGAQAATIMQQIAKGYSDAQLELIAAYLATQPRERYGQEP